MKPSNPKMKRMTFISRRTPRSGMRRAWFDLSFCLTQRRKDAKVLLRKAIHDTLDPSFIRLAPKLREKPKLQSPKLSRSGSLDLRLGGFSFFLGFP